MSVETLFLIGAAQAFFLAFVLVYNKKDSLANRWLIAWLLFIGVHLVFVNFGFSGVYRRYPILIVFGAALMLLQGPFLYLYTLIATNKIKFLKGKHLLHIIPYFFYTAYLGYLFASLPSPDKFENLSSIILGEENWLLVSLGLFNHLHIIVYLLFSILLLKKHAERLTDTFSFVENINLKWLRNLLIGITIVASIIVIGLLASDLFPFVSHYIKATLIYSALALLPFYMSFYAIRQKLIYPTRADVLNTKYEDSQLTQADSQRIAYQLTEHMKTNKPYLNPVLSIKDLSEDLNVHPKNLSRVINENFDKNFFNFINTYRVDEFKERVKDPKNSNYTLIAIAYDCGFNTKSSFNSIFKKTTGLTPSAFKAQLK